MVRLSKQCHMTITTPRSASSLSSVARSRTSQQHCSPLPAASCPCFLRQHCRIVTLQPSTSSLNDADPRSKEGAVVLCQHFAAVHNSVCAALCRQPHRGKDVILCCQHERCAVQACQQRQRQPQEDPFHLLAPHLLQISGWTTLACQDRDTLHLHWPATAVGSGYHCPAFHGARSGAQEAASGGFVVVCSLLLCCHHQCLLFV